MMARGIQLCGGVAALALMLTHGAQAATPTVAGTYAMMGWHICQLTVATPKSSVSDVTGTIKVKAVTDIFSSTKNVIAAVTVARTLYTIRRPASSDHCMDAMTLTKH
jgi:hypothetical protein